MTVDLSVPNVQVSWVTLNVLSHDDDDNIAAAAVDDEYQNDEGIQVPSQAGCQLKKPLHSWDSSLFNYVCIKIRLFCLLYVQ